LPSGRPKIEITPAVRKILEQYCRGDITKTQAAGNLNVCLNTVTRLLDKTGMQKLQTNYGKDQVRLLVQECKSGKITSYKSAAEFLGTGRTTVKRVLGDQGIILTAVAPAFDHPLIPEAVRLYRTCTFTSIEETAKFLGCAHKTARKVLIEAGVIRSLSEAQRIDKTKGYREKASAAGQAMEAYLPSDNFVRNPPKKLGVHKDVRGIKFHPDFDRAVDMYKAGATSRDVAAILGYNDGSVRAVLGKLGVLRSRKEASQIRRFKLTKKLESPEVRRIVSELSAIITSHFNKTGGLSE
jgi:hypothetical protein